MRGSALCAPRSGPPGWVRPARAAASPLLTNARAHTCTHTHETHTQRTPQHPSAAARTNYPITEYLGLLGGGGAQQQQRLNLLGDGFGGGGFDGGGAGGAGAGSLGGASAYAEQLALQDLVNAGAGGSSQLHLQQQLLSLAGGGGGGDAAQQLQQQLLRQLDDTALALARGREVTSGFGSSGGGAGAGGSGLLGALDLSGAGGVGQLMEELARQQAAGGGDEHMGDGGDGGGGADGQQAHGQELGQHEQQDAHAHLQHAQQDGGGAGAGGYQLPADGGAAALAHAHAAAGGGNDANGSNGGGGDGGAGVGTFSSLLDAFQGQGGAATSSAFAAALAAQPAGLGGAGGGGAGAAGAFGGALGDLAGLGQYSAALSVDPFGALNAAGLGAGAGALAQLPHGLDPSLAPPSVMAGGGAAGGPHRSGSLGSAGAGGGGLRTKAPRGAAGGEAEAHSFRGVFWDKKSRRWRCQLGHKNKKIFLGYFNDAAEAARAYDAKLVELNGANGAGPRAFPFSLCICFSLSLSISFSCARSDLSRSRPAACSRHRAPPAVGIARPLPGLAHVARPFALYVILLTRSQDQLPAS